jgi:hypothetical protein
MSLHMHASQLFTPVTRCPGSNLRQAAAAALGSAREHWMASARCHCTCTPAARCPG